MIFSPKLHNIQSGNTKLRPQVSAVNVGDRWPRERWRSLFSESSKWMTKRYGKLLPDGNERVVHLGVLESKVPPCSSKFQPPAFTQNTPKVCPAYLRVSLVSIVLLCFIYRRDPSVFCCYGHNPKTKGVKCDSKLFFGPKRLGYRTFIFALNYFL